MIKLAGAVVGFVLLAAPAGAQEDIGCGWCGPAASLGRALALGGPAPCYCPPPEPKRHPAPVVKAPPPPVVEPAAKVPPPTEPSLECKDDMNMASVYDDLRSAGIGEGEATKQAMRLLSADGESGNEIIRQLLLLHVVYTTSGLDRVDIIRQRVMQVCQIERNAP